MVVLDQQQPFDHIAAVYPAAVELVSLDETSWTIARIAHMS